MVKSKFPKPKAGIMLSALGLLLIVGLVFYQALENRGMTANLAVRTQRMHRVKVMREMFWYNYLQLSEEQRPESGEVIFDQGELVFFAEKGIFKVRIRCEERSYLYQYPDFLTDNQPDSSLEDL